MACWSCDVSEQHCMRCACCRIKFFAVTSGPVSGGGGGGSSSKKGCRLLFLIGMAGVIGLPITSMIVGWHLWT